jgi:hypothetical protein
MPHHRRLPPSGPPITGPTRHVPLPVLTGPPRSRPPRRGRLHFKHPRAAGLPPCPAGLRRSSRRGWMATPGRRRMGRSTPAGWGSGLDPAGAICERTSAGWGSGLDRPLVGGSQDRRHTTDGDTTVRGEGVVIDHRYADTSNHTRPDAFAACALWSFITALRTRATTPPAPPLHPVAVRRRPDRRGRAKRAPRQARFADRG